MVYSKLERGFKRELLRASHHRCSTGPRATASPLPWTSAAFRLHSGYTLANAPPGNRRPRLRNLLGKLTDDSIIMMILRGIGGRSSGQLRKVASTLAVPAARGSHRRFRVRTGTRGSMVTRTRLGVLPGPVDSSWLRLARPPRSELERRSAESESSRQLERPSHLKLPSQAESHDPGPESDAVQSQSLRAPATRRGNQL